MTLLAYQSGLQALGRQIRLLPVAWTPDGSFEVPKANTGVEPITSTTTDGKSACFRSGVMWHSAFIEELTRAERWNSDSRIYLSVRITSHVAPQAIS
jgi:hypothetical protein